ncbi:MAG: hypothetical protein ABI151_12960 [Chitinophagaceae bacterium]
MKKLLFIFAFALFFVTQSQAQIQKGNVMVGADLANIQLSLNKGGNFNVRIDPKAAWFIKDNVAVGAYLNLGLMTAKGAGTAVNYGVGALARYYVGDKGLDLVQHSKFFVEGNVGIEGFNPTTGNNTNGLGLGIGPGIAYFVTPNIGLEALVKYNGIVGFGSSVSSDNLNFGLGFQIYLPSSKIKNEVRKLKN